MKVVKRVSLLKSLQRITEPSKSSFKIQRMEWNRTAPYRLTTEQQLFKFGYKNYKHSIFLVSGALFAFFSGALFQILYRQLLDNERETIYRYKSKEREQPGLLLGVRLLLQKIVARFVSQDLFPFYQYCQLIGFQSKIDEKHIRYQQYCHFMAKRDNKYDFLQLGVLQKFPYPVTQSIPEPQIQ